jgi:Uma2 family endonuclease
MSVVPIQPPTPQRTGLQVSYEEFLELGDEYRHAEWVNGEVVMMAAVTDEHDAMTMFLGSVLHLYCETRRFGRVLREPFQMKTGPDLPGRSPDIFVVSNANLGRIQKKNLNGPADVVVEVVSPGSRRVDRVEKFQEYERGGVQEYWLIDPHHKTAEFYRLISARYEEVMADDRGHFRSSVLPDFWLDANWLQQRPLPPVLDVLRELRVI